MAKVLVREHVSWYFIKIRLNEAITFPGPHVIFLVKRHQAHSCSIWIKITLLGRNFTKVRNIMGKDIKIEMNRVSPFPPPPFNFLPAKYLPMAIALFISYKMRPIHHSYLLKPWVQYSSWAQYLYLFQIQDTCLSIHGSKVVARKVSFVHHMFWREIN